MLHASSESNHASDRHHDHLIKLLCFTSEALAQVLACEICEISKNTFFTEHLRKIASVSNLKCQKMIYLKF